MHRLGSREDVWVLRPNEDDLRAGARYAAISLPWTFNRMMLNTGSAGQQMRGLNIAKGIVGQEMLKRKMWEVGIRAETERKSHRADDLFDFNAEVDGVMTKMDLKSFHYYRDYRSLGREPFTVDLLMRHADYGGADWRRFFPMLVPHTQIEQTKESYCFAIASSFDIRRDIATDRIDYALTAFPYGRHLEFFSSQRLCLAREDAGRGFHINLLYTDRSMFADDVTVTVMGEWEGEASMITETLRPGVGKELGPFSCVSSFGIDRDSFGHLDGSITVSLSGNAFTDPVLNTSRRNTNSFPETPFILRKRDFCNLFLPSEYTLHVVGWIYKDEFLEACRRYRGWIWPLDKVDRFRNQAWRTITAADRKLLIGKGFGDAIPNDGEALRAGWLKTTGRGAGACCYMFPNIGFGGGVKETNLYVLPRDLYCMKSLLYGRSEKRW